MFATLALALAAPQWPTQLVTHAAPAPNQDQGYGLGVHVEGDTAVVGASGGPGIPGNGRVYVFARDPGGWSAVQTIEHPEPGLASSFGAFGVAVEVDGDLLAIGDSAWGSSSGIGGRAWFYRRSSGSFLLEGDTAFFPPGGAGLGSSVAVDEANERIAVAAGAYAPSGGTGVGGVWIYEHTGSAWVAVDDFTPSSTVSSFNFAESMALSGDLLLAGHPRHGSTPWIGGVFVFERVGGAWVETDVIEAPQPQNNDQFGTALAFDGSTLLVGVPGRNGSTGVVHEFARDAQGSFGFVQEIAPTAAEPGMGFGRGLALAGNLALAGAPSENVAEQLDPGAVRVLTRQAGSWSQVARLTDPHPGPSDNLGNHLALDGTRALAGNPSDDWVGTNAGSALFFDLFPTGLTYCTAGTSASGCAALLTTAGQPSASAPAGFVLAAQGVEGQRQGLFYFGTSGRQANPWGTGSSFQCVAPPVTRTPVASSGGTAGACDGALARDLNALWCPGCPNSSKNPGAGATVQAQLWYRDPASTSNQTTSLSDAVEFFVAP